MCGCIYPCSMAAGRKQRQGPAEEWRLRSREAASFAQARTLQHAACQPCVGTRVGFTLVHAQPLSGSVGSTLPWAADHRRGGSGSGGREGIYSRTPRSSGECLACGMLHLCWQGKDSWLCGGSNGPMHAFPPPPPSFAARLQRMHAPPSPPSPLSTRLFPCRGRGGPRGRRGDKDEEKWVPCTKLGRLVQQGKIKSMEQIYLFSMPVKEYQVVEYFLGTALKDEVMQIMPVQKQTSAGQRTRFKVRRRREETRERRGKWMLEGSRCARTVKATAAPNLARPVTHFGLTRPSSWSATTTATSAWASSAPRRWPPPSAAPSSRPRCASCPSAVATGETRSERCTPCPPRSPVRQP